MRKDVLTTLDEVEEIAMARKKIRSKNTKQLLSAMQGGNNHARCEVLRELCPCRNSQVRDLAVWREIFRNAIEGDMHERHQAAHAIGTLMEKAQTSAGWREILGALEGELDRLMRDTRASRMLLGQMGAHRSAALRTYRRRRKVLDLATPTELADWVNSHPQLARQQRVSSNDTGVRLLWRWMKHRVEFQPERGTQEDELIEKARRYLPQLFQRSPGALHVR